MGSLLLLTPDKEVKKEIIEPKAELVGTKRSRFALRTKSREGEHSPAEGLREG